MSQQLTVSVPPSLEPEVEERLAGSEEGRETRAFFFEYLSRRANHDNDLRESDAQIIHQEREQAVRAVAGSSDAAAEVASRLADLGKWIACVGVALSREHGLLLAKCVLHRNVCASNGVLVYI